MNNSPLPGPLPEGEGILRRKPGGFFITGTDTCVGKTRITLGVMRTLQRQGLRVAGMKPVASGCEMTAEGLRNEDALLLQQHSSTLHAYDMINPYAFAPAIAPHLAAERSGVRIVTGPIIERFDYLATQCDAVVIEGAGGWLVPLNDQQSIADLTVAIGLPVILVVAIRLGCINHALLTAQSIRASGCRLAGWIANHVNPADDESIEIIQSIRDRIATPLLGQVDYHPILDMDRLAGSIDSAALIQACEK